MTRFTPDVEAAIVEGVRPTPGDVAEARSVALELLGAQASVHEFEIREAVRLRRGVTPEPVAVELDRPAGAFAVPDPQQNGFLLVRTAQAAKEALAQLWSQGVIIPVAGGHHGVPRAHVEVRWQGNGGSVEYENVAPVFNVGNNRWRLADPDPAHPREVLTAEDFTEGLADVLGERGLRCLREAHVCWRRGLYLAAGNLIATASEAAWYTLTAALAEGDTRMRGSLEEAERGALGKAIETVSDRLRVVLGHPLKGRVTETKATAYQLRDVRNYGLHPRSEHDSDREAYFTEAGAAMLVLASRRYFEHLAGFLAEVRG